MMVNINRPVQTIKNLHYLDIAFAIVGSWIKRAALLTACIGVAYLRPMVSSTLFKYENL